MEFRELIVDFAAGLGVTDVAFDDEGVARLQADDMLLAFAEQPETGTLVFWCKVATPPPERLEQLYRLILEASFMGRGTQGAVFSLDGDDVYLHRTDSLATLDVKSLAGLVEGFLNVVERWRGVVESFRADDSAPAAPEEEPPAFGLGSLGFMQV